MSPLLEREKHAERQKDADIRALLKTMLNEKSMEENNFKKRMQQLNLQEDDISDSTLAKYGYTFVSVRIGEKTYCGPALCRESSFHNMMIVPKKHKGGPLPVPKKEVQCLKRLLTSLISNGPLTRDKLVQMISHQQLDAEPTTVSCVINELINKKIILKSGTSSKAPGYTIGPHGCLLLLSAGELRGDHKMFVPRCPS